MPLSSLAIRTQSKPLKIIFAQYIIILLTGYLSAAILSPTLWAKHTTILHTTLELICIFIMLSTFFTVWYAYANNPPVNQVMGFGFLMVAIFDIFHAFYYPGLNLYPPGYYDLSARYWIMGRYAEAAVLLICSFRMLSVKVNRWAGLILSTALASGLCYLILYFPGLMPVLHTEHGLTSEKIAMEYIIIAVFFASLYHLKNKVHSRDILTYRYIFLAIMIAIPAELCFTSFTTLTSFPNTLGHILKVIYYYCLFRGIYVSAITYPYEKLNQAGRYMDEILNGLPVGLVTFDSNQRLSFINRKALKISGCSEKELIGLNAGQLTSRFFGEEDEEDNEIIKQLTRNSIPVKNNVKTIKNNNANIKIRIDTQRLDDGGSLFLFTEAKKEQELESLQLQTQAILNSLRNLVVLVDKGNQVIMCNKAFEAAVEIDSRDILGINLKNLQKLLRFRRKVAPAKIMPGEYLKTAYEASFSTAGGKRRELVFQYAPISNVDGEVIGGIVVASDVTVLKQEQQKLQQWEKLALLGEMAAGVVHEIKNPLTTIKGFSHIIATKANNQAIKSYACIIENTANDVNRVVSDFLAFARPRSPVLMEISLNDLVKSMRLMLESHLFIKGVDLDFNFSAQEKIVMADKDQIKQVVLNIVKNAVEAMNGTKKPRLIISTGLSDIKDEMFITISDNGRGMTPEDRLKAATPFYTTKDNVTGLGLSFCFQIVNKHGGRIDIKSEPLRGTSLTISLPCKVTDDHFPPLPGAGFTTFPREAAF